MTVVKALQQSWIDELEIATQSIWPLLQRVRRHLHQHPELSLQEFETSRYIYALLKDHQLEPQLISSRNGVVCDYHFGTDSPVNIRVGLRGDIDALPIQTCSPATYASERPGVMHACGHDAHATMTLGATLLVKRMAEGGHLPWPVSIRSMFQPAEEVSRGGRMLIEEGFISDLSHAFALHVDPSLMVGHIATRRGAITAGCASIAVHVVGQTGHSARPHLASDALAAGVQFINQAYFHVPRSHDCRDAAVLHFGTFHSGTANNIVTNEARLTGTLRTLSDDTQRAILDRLNAIAKAVGETTGCQIQISLGDFTPTLNNNAKLALEVLRICEQLPRVELASELPMPSMGAEDFAFIASKVPACLMRIGTASRDGLTNRFPLHSASFDIDESVLCIGAQVLAAAAIDACQPVAS